MVSLSVFHFHLSHATEISASFSTAAASNLDKQGVSGHCTEDIEESGKRKQRFAICRINIQETRYMLLGTLRGVSIICRYFVVP